MNNYLIWIVIILSYLLGSVNTAIVVTKLWGKGDIRDYGSKSGGTTNAIRVLGKKGGALVFIFDLAKGVLVCSTCMILKINLYIPALAVVLGHIFPVFFMFRGGKGMAISLVIILFLNWQYGLISIGILALTILLTRWVSLGTILCIMTFTVLESLDGLTLNWFLVLTLCIIILIKHRTNIKRLLTGCEDKIFQKRSEVLQ